MIDKGSSLKDVDAVAMAGNEREANIALGALISVLVLSVLVLIG